MHALDGPVLAFLTLLALAGAMKVARPAATSGALRAAKLPSSILVVRALGALEVAAGVVGVVTGDGRAVAMAAVLYGGFAWFVLNAIRRHLPISSCGCLGAAETPPSLIHVTVNLVAMTVLSLSAITSIGPWGGMTGMPVRESVPFVLLTGVTVYLLYAVITVLPRQRSRRPVSESGKTPETLVNS